MRGKGPELAPPETSFPCAPFRIPVVIRPVYVKEVYNEHNSNFEEGATSDARLHNVLSA